ncbi:TonB-dependent receptor [Planktosalinus lacus]|uniref:TonB-dependent receptor n=2 Tax=Planktosalinus lacus TaxID=1526573 RepID=A0A8J2VFH9_9FLAO|nr:TonB-dependent receptor [Planktosalinus lacus]
MILASIGIGARPTLNDHQSSANRTTISTENIGKIQGTVIDQNLNQPLPYVTIVVENMAGEILTGGITDDLGTFNINSLKLGNYTVKIQYIGYKPYVNEIEVTKENPSINLGTIALEEDIASLDEVVVVAERSTIVQKIDRKVINVGKDLTTTGASASEIMNNIPSVNIDQDGNISLRGNPNVRILVDGKPTNIDAAQLLKQIPSTSIKQIELITNPSAKYNPEGMSGIINIILHKNMNDGFNGDITLGLTKYNNAQFNTSVNLNYRTGKFNFYTNYGARVGKQANLGKINRFDNPSTTDYNERSTENIDMLNSYKSHLMKFGFDYFINDFNTLSVYTNQNIYNDKFQALLRIDYPGQDRESLSQNVFVKNENDNASYNLAYKHKFKNEGHEIQLEGDYNTFENDEVANAIYPDFSDLSYTDLVFNERENITLNIDYTNPISENAKLELGLEARIQNTKNNFDTNSLSFTDARFFYDREIFSGYATFGQNFEKWSYQIGARIENYTVDAGFTESNEDEVPFEDEILSVYPSGFISYNINEKNTLQMSLSRRVDRPGINQINPIREFSTPQISQIGNQELVPQFTNSVELNYTKQLEKGSITGGVFYRMIQDEINQNISIDPEDPTRIILSYTNFEDNNAYGVEVSASYKPTKWWSFNASFDLFQQTMKGVVANEQTEVDNTSYTFRVNNSFKATKDLTFQAFGFYRGPYNGLQFNSKEFYFVNAGVRYNVMQGQATISFNYNDLLNTRKFQFDTDKPMPASGQFNPESQGWNVGLSYRFGGAKNRTMARKQRDNNEAQGGGLF